MNHDDIYRHTGSLIRERRKALNLTQDDLAKRVGISRASVANIEVGRQSLLVHQLVAIAAALMLPPTDFLEGLMSDIAVEGDDALPLPTDLNPKQREQIVRLLGKAGPEPRRARGQRDAKK